ncbi:MAG TPA: cytochrome P450 [Chitinophagaceae bacterium]|nr:cytochrome P450 [Chitinophagaceae bacterium]
MSSINKTKLPPGPGAKIPLGHLFSFQRDGLGFLRKIADEYGDIVHFKIGPIRIALLNHPDYIKEVLSKHHRNFIKGRPLEMAKEILGEGLLTSEGEFHDRQSRIIQPAFHRKMLESYASVITDYTNRMMNSWQEGMQVDMMKEMMNLSTSIAGKAFFSKDLEKEAPEITKALVTASSLFGRISVPFSEWLLKIPIPGTTRFLKAKALLDEIIYQIIDDRKQSGIDNGDLLSLLIRAQNEKGPEGGMSDKQIHDEAITLFLTAFDTTSIALTWTWYLLFQNPGAEAELHNEIDSVLNDRIPTAEDLSHLKYTRMVMGESMRLYPPIYIIAREAVNDFEIDKYVLRAGTLILMSPYLIHRDPRFHQDPEKFNPHTWDKLSRNESSKYQYFPFGVGPRSCIGQHFAWMEGILVLASIAQSWRLELVPGHPVKLQQRINLRPKYGMLMKLRRRK